MDEKTYVKGFHDPEKVKKITYNDFGTTGMRVSFIGIGGAPFGDAYGNLPEEESIATIHECLKLGLNYIDTAPWYGQGRSEMVIGKALKGIPRSAYYLATKAGRYSLEVPEMFDFSAKKIYEGFNTSLKLLGVEYVDLIQVHDIEFAEDINQIINETLPTLQKIVDEGRARFIGITGFDLETLKYVLDNSKVQVSAVLSYTHITMLDKTMLDYIPHFQKAGVGIINASITAMGILSSAGVKPWHPAKEDIRNAGIKANDMAKSRGIELAHLAIESSVHAPGVSTNLMGCTSTTQFLESIAIATQPQPLAHKQLAEDIEKQVFSKLAKRSWGDEYLTTYFKEKKQLAGSS